MSEQNENVFDFNGNSVHERVNAKNKQLVKFIGMGAIALTGVIGIGIGINYISSSNDRQAMEMGGKVVQERVSQTQIVSMLDDLTGKLKKSYSSSTSALLGYISPEVKDVVDFTDNQNPERYKREINSNYQNISSQLKKDQAIVDSVYTKLNTSMDDKEKLKLYSSPEFKRFYELQEASKDAKKQQGLYNIASLDKITVGITDDIKQIKEDRAALEDDAKKALAAMQKSGKSFKDVEKDLIVNNDKELTAKLDELKKLKADGADISDAQIASLQAELALAKAEAAKKIAEDRAALELAQTKLNQPVTQNPQQVVVHHDSGPSFGTLMMLYAWNNAFSNNNNNNYANYRADQAEDRARNAEYRAQRAEDAVKRIESKGSYSYTKPNQMYSFGENSYLSQRMTQNSALANAQKAQKAGVTSDPFKMSRPTYTAPVPQPSYGSVKQDNSKLQCIGVQCLNAIKEAKTKAQNDLAAKAEAQRSVERAKVAQNQKIDQERVRAQQQIERTKADSQRAAQAANNPAPAPPPSKSSFFNSAKNSAPSKSFSPPPPAPSRSWSPPPSRSPSFSGGSRKR